MTHFKKALAYPNRATALIFMRVAQHKKILAVIRSVLPETLANHALYCVLENRKLLIYAQSAVWTSQLRFYSPAMLAAVNAQANVYIELIRLKIIQQHSDQHTTKAKKIPAQDVIASIEDELVTTADSKLKRALLKLNETLRKLGEEKKV
jgi:hypothetical protein